MRFDVNMFAYFRFVAPSEREEFRNDVLDRLKALKELARGCGITLLHENERGIFGEYAAQNVDLAVTLADETFGLIFDPSNYVQAGEDALVSWRLVKPWVRYLHIKDSVYARGFDDEANPHRLAGSGDARLKELFDEISATDFAGYFSIEPHLTKGMHPFPVTQRRNG